MRFAVTFILLSFLRSVFSTNCGVQDYNKIDCGFSGVNQQSLKPKVVVGCQAQFPQFPGAIILKAPLEVAISIK